MQQIPTTKHQTRFISRGDHRRRASWNPPLILADEPTGNLDPQLSAEIMALFRRFQTVGVTVLIATHDVSLINRMRLRILRLNDGTLAEDSGKHEKDAE